MFEMMLTVLAPSSAWLHTRVARLDTQKAGQAEK